MDVAQIILTSSVVGVLASSLFTFITFLINRSDEKKKAISDKNDKTTTCLAVQAEHEKNFAKIETKLEGVSNICLGLAYDRIIHVGEAYLKRGSITVDEREDFRKYLWGPYHAAGGNGSGDAMMRSIDDLPIAPKK